MLAMMDACLLMLSLWLSFSLRLGVWFSPQEAYDGVSPSFRFSTYVPFLSEFSDTTWLLIVAPLIGIPVFIRFGLYRAILRYINYRAMWSVTQAVFFYALLWATLTLLSGANAIPRSVVLINFSTTLLLVGGLRMLIRYVYLLAIAKKSKKIDSSQQRVVIYGAGAAGRQLAQSISLNSDLSLCGFVDDDPALQGRILLGVPIVGPYALQVFLGKCAASDLFLAMPSVPRKRRQVVLESLRGLPVRVRTLPNISDLVRGKIGSGDIGELDVDDLLGRSPVPPDLALLGQCVSSRVVLVTGAGGSIGGELCRQILRLRPKTLLLLESNEYALYEIHQELLKFSGKLEEDAGGVGSTQTAIRLVPRILPILGSVQNVERMHELMQTWKPDVVYHAAAYKHVPMVEHNASEGLKNNLFGTLIVARAAIQAKVRDFVLISTDKAVRPTNIMGASKRLAEMVLQAMAANKEIQFDCINEPTIELQNETHFSMVRFGNVLGSSGSVVPLFRKQIQSGGPVTLTHPEVTRYFMSISEAALLVMQSGALHDGMRTKADVYVLDMGEPVKIYDLARRMIELSGFRVRDDDCPQGDVSIEITGLRPGEKLYEELLIGDSPQPTRHPRIMKASEGYLDWAQLQPKLRTLRIAIDNNDVEAIRHLLLELVDGYSADPELVDWMYLEQIRTH